MFRYPFCFIIMYEDRPITDLHSWVMRVCCFRVFVGGELWDCLLILKHNQNNYVLYTTIDQLPFQVLAELHALQQNGTRELEPTVMDANCWECIVKTLENSHTFRQSVVRKMNAVAMVDNNNIVVGVKDVCLETPKKCRLAYIW